MLAFNYLGQLGRLGNQMFVFATALTLALKTNSRIVIESKIINAKITLKNVFKNIYWDEQVIIKPTKTESCLLTS